MGCGSAGIELSVHAQPEETAVQPSHVVEAPTLSLKTSCASVTVFLVQLEPTMGAPRAAALRELDNYARSNVEHSRRQYARHGTLHDQAGEALRAREVWDQPWVPDDFDVGEARLHPVFQSWTDEQKLAWNHLQWGLEYGVVGQGEKQIVVLNKYAVRAYRDLLPSVVELEARESFEEIDHLEAFAVGLEGLRARYLPHRTTPLYAQSPSGFAHERLNRLLRHGLGYAAHKLLGPGFPTLFFLTRGIKTHNFKPFENAIAGYKDAPHGIRQVSHLHRLDESRHMATALYLARLSDAVLGTLPETSRLFLQAAVKAAWPPGRVVGTRLQYWRTALDEALPFQSVSRDDKDALFAHIEARTADNLLALHARQQKLTRQANKRIVEEAGLPLSVKRAFVEALRADPYSAALVEAVELPEA